MATTFVLVKSYKSAGIAILLTLLFGPVGLFYASVTAGLMMTFIIPVLLLIIIIVAASQDASLLEFSVIITFLLLLFIGLFAYFGQ